MFDDRLEAGRVLASELTERGLDSHDSIILGLPRGGVVVAFAVHQALHLPLDVFITRKLRAPENPEFAVGALAETGYRFINPEVHGWAADARAREFLERETEHQRREIERRRRLYRGGAALPDLDGRGVLVVDDGVATGSTIIASIRGIRTLHPAWIVVAAPVGSPGTVVTLRREADDVVVPNTPSRFRAVGEYYKEFPQVDDDQVVAYLNAARIGEAIG